jgi:hypothetical protein
VSQRPSRIEAARRRAAGAKRFALGAAGVGFLAALLLARAGHPGQSTSSSGSVQPQATQSQVQQSQSESDDAFDSGSASIAPSTATPQVQTNVS